MKPLEFAKQFELTGHAAGVYDLCAGPSDDVFFSASGDGFVALWNLTSGAQEKFSVRIGKPVYAVLYIGQHDLLLAGTGEGQLHVIQLQERKEEKCLALHEKGIFKLHFHPLNNHLYVAGGDGVLSIWAVPEMKLLLSFKLSDEKLRAMAISPDGRTLAVSGADGMVRVFETDFYNETHAFKAHPDGVSSLCFHPAKPLLYSGGKDALLKLWRTDHRFEPLLSLPAHNFNIYGLATDQSGDVLFTSSRDKTAKAWHTNDMECLARLDRKSAAGHTHSVNALLWNEAHRTLITGGDDRRIIAWRTF